MKNNSTVSSEKSSNKGFVKETLRDKGYRKAAQFLLLLGKDEAAKVLKHLTEDEVKGITKEIASIKKVDPREAEKVLEEFGYLAATKDLIARGGLEKAKEMLIKAFGDEKGNQLYKKIEMKTVPHPFSFLMDLDMEQVKMLLKDESAPVIAVILPHLQPELASKLLASLDRKMQKDVVLRISKMKQINPEVLRRVEDALKNKIRMQGEIITEEVDGKSSLAEILKHMSASEEKKILSELQEENPDLAREIEKKIFTIDIVNFINDKDLQKILRDYSDRELAIILKGLQGENESAREKILANVSERRREIIEDEMVSMKPLLKSEVEKTIDDFLDYIKLEDARGSITIEKPDEEYV